MMQFYQNCFFLTSLISISFSSILVKAQDIVPDTTTQTNVRQTDDVIEINGGLDNGNNLFHSFQEFSISQGKEAFFNNASNIENIFSRVTGTSLSNIDGKIRANDNANLFLINPNGIIFGENASLDIGGSFLATTAEKILFNDGTEFSALNSQSQPLLTVSVPIGLGLSNNSQAIEVRGSSLAIKPNQTLAIVGNNLLFTSANLSIPGGKIELGSIAEKGIVRLNTVSSDWQLGYENIQNFNDVELRDGSVVDVSGDVGGFIQIQGSFVSLKNGSRITSLTFGSQPGGDVSFNVQNLLLESSTSGTLAGGEGNGGNLYINSANTVRLNKGFLAFQTASTGNAGNAVVNAKKLIIDNGSSISGESFGTGKAGNASIQALESVELSNSSGIFTNSNGGGDGGNLSVATKNLTVQTGSRISAGAFANNIPLESFSAKPGNLTIVATESASIAGVSNQGRRSSISIVSQSTADSGSLTIETDKLIVEEGGFISTETLNSGRGANLKIKAKDFIELIGIDGELETVITAGVEGTGDGGNIEIDTNRLTVTNGANINSLTISAGDAGKIEITAENIELTGTKINNEQFSGSGIFATASPQSFGNSNDLTINTEQLLIADGAIVSTGSRGSGKGGNVTINASELIEIVGVSPNGEFSTRIDNISTKVTENNTDDTTLSRSININTKKLLLRDGGQISATAFNGGLAGNLIVNASESVQLEGTASVGELFPSALFSRVVRGGRKGNIIINTPQLAIANGARIETSIDGESLTNIASSAGNIQINAAEIEVFGIAELKGSSSRIASDSITNATGKAGEIELNTNSLNIFDGGVVSTKTDTDFSGGKITVKANDLQLLNGGQILTTSSSRGNAGNIFLDVGNDITLNGKDSGLFANTLNNSTGKGGSIITNNQKAQNISVANNAKIAVNSDGEGEGGSIDLAADNIQLNNGAITAETQSNQGGNIALNIAENLELRNAKITATAGTAEARGNGGNVTINSGFILAFPTTNQHEITAEAFEGQGGNINITTNNILGRESIEISASSNFGIDGTISIETPDVDPTSGVVELADVPVDAEAILAQDLCRLEDGKIAKGSSFIITGRGGLTPTAEDSLGNINNVVGWANRADLDLSNDGTVGVRQRLETETPVNNYPVIQQSQGWVKADDGSVWLVANTPQTVPQKVKLNHPDCNNI